jgi:hypothetical protein
MAQLWTWLLGAGVLGYLILKWNSDRTQRNESANFFNEIMDSKIATRDEAIKAVAEKQAKTLEEYYAKRAKYHNNLLRDPNRHTPDEGNS